MAKKTATEQLFNAKWTALYYGVQHAVDTNKTANFILDRGALRLAKIVAVMFDSIGDKDGDINEDETNSTINLLGQTTATEVLIAAGRDPDTTDQITANIALLFVFETARKMLVQSGDWQPATIIPGPMVSKEEIRQRYKPVKKERAKELAKQAEREDDERLKEYARQVGTRIDDPRDHLETVTFEEAWEKITTGFASAIMANPDAHAMLEKAADAMGGAEAGLEEAVEAGVVSADTGNEICKTVGEAEGNELLGHLSVMDDPVGLNPEAIQMILFERAGSMYASRQIPDASRESVSRMRDQASGNAKRAARHKWIAAFGDTGKHEVMINTNIYPTPVKDGRHWNN